MATKKPKRFRLDTAALRAEFELAVEQFRDLKVKNIVAWPAWPRRAVWVGSGLLSVGLFWFFVIQADSAQLSAARDRENALRQEFRTKLRIAANLTEYQRQKVQVQEYVTQLEKQLPSRADLDALLSDVTQAGVGRGLQFELFKPSGEVIKDHYAELPVSIKVTGRFHDIGAFTSDLATLPRIVTLRNVTISAPAPAVGTAAKASATVQGLLTLEGTVRTFRYLDDAEVEARRKAKAEAAKAARK